MAVVDCVCIGRENRDYEVLPSSFERKYLCCVVFAGSIVVVLLLAAVQRKICCVVVTVRLVVAEVSDCSLENIWTS